MNVIRETQKKYCSRSMITAIVTGFLLIIAGQSSIGKGLILGTLFSVLNFIVMGEVLPLKVGKTRRKASFIAFGSIISRYILLAVPIIMGIKFVQFNLCSVIVGIFMVQIMILSEHIKNAFFFMRKH